MIPRNQMVWFEISIQCSTRSGGLSKLCRLSLLRRSSSRHLRRVPWFSFQRWVSTHEANTVLLHNNFHLIILCSFIVEWRKTFKHLLFRRRRRKPARLKVLPIFATNHLKYLVANNKSEFFTVLWNRWTPCNKKTKFRNEMNAWMQIKSTKNKPGNIWCYFEIIFKLHYHFPT